MANEQEEIIVEEGVVDKATLWFDKNKKSVFIIGGAVVAIIGGYFAYKYLYVNKREAKATAALYENKKDMGVTAPFTNFEHGNFRLAAEGAESGKGLNKIVKEYGSTKSGAVAEYMYGISLMNLGAENPENYDNAIKVLENVDFGDDEVMLTTIAIGAIGDCLIEKGEFAKAAAKYLEAAKRQPNELTTPIFLKKAGVAYEENGEASKAVGLYEQIKNDYPTSSEFRDIDKYIARAKNS